MITGSIDLVYKQSIGIASTSLAQINLCKFLFLLIIFIVLEREYQVFFSFSLSLWAERKVSFFGTDPIAKEFVLPSMIQKWTVMISPWKVESSDIKVYIVTVICIHMQYICICMYICTSTSVYRKLRKTNKWVISIISQIRKVWNVVMLLGQVIQLHHI